MTHPIFSFGTLQLESVQQELFGRAVATTPDALAGYRIKRAELKQIHE